MAPKHCTRLIIRLLSKINRRVRLDAPVRIHTGTRWVKTHPTITVLLLLFALSGCHSEEPMVQPTPEPKPTGPVHQVGNSETLAKLIQQHQGKVILIDFWAMWCLQCVDKFPEIVLLSRKYPEDLVVISVSFDDPKQKDASVEFLKSQDAPLDLIVSESGAGSASAEDFDVPGDLPFYRLLDRDGNVHAQFNADSSAIENGFPIEELETQVSELIDKN